MTRRIVLIIITSLCVGSLSSVQRAHGAEDAYCLFDRMGDTILVSRGSDIFIQKIDGSDTVRVTSTPDIPERDAFFSRDGRYCLFEVDRSRYYADGVVDIRIERYMQPIAGDETARIEIGEDLYRDFKKERILDKHRSVSYLEYEKSKESSPPQRELESLKTMSQEKEVQ